MDASQSTNPDTSKSRESLNKADLQNRTLAPVPFRLHNRGMSIRALTIAASDPSGGAGIEADLKVFSAFRVSGATAITAITEQDTAGTYGMVPTGLATFEKNLTLMSADMPLSAIKTGALATAGHAGAVARFLKSLSPLPPVVIDPVLSATSGASLMDGGAAREAYLTLIPHAAVITPNISEAGLLADMEVADRESMERAGRALLEMGAGAALITGGHLGEGSVDMLVHPGGVDTWENEILPFEFHGTGCVLSSAIAAGLARAMGMVEAVDRARSYLSLAIAGAIKGKGDARVLDFPLIL